MKTEFIFFSEFRPILLDRITYYCCFLFIFDFATTLFSRIGKSWHFCENINFAIPKYVCLCSISEGFNFANVCTVLMKFVNLSTSQNPVVLLLQNVNLVIQERREVMYRKTGTSKVDNFTPIIFVRSPPHWM